MKPYIYTKLHSYADKFLLILEKILRSNYTIPMRVGTYHVMHLKIFLFCVNIIKMSTCEYKRTDTKSLQSERKTSVLHDATSVCSGKRKIWWL